MSGDNLVTAVLARTDYGGNEDTVLLYALDGLRHGLIVPHLEWVFGERVQLGDWDPKSVAKLKAKIRMLTSRSNGWGSDYRKAKRKRQITGWVNYFKIAGMKTLLHNIDEWMRRRIRALIWKQWKKIKTKYRNLRKLGIRHEEAYKTANTSNKYWRAVNGATVKAAITNDRLRRAGYGHNPRSREVPRTCVFPYSSVAAVS